MKNLIIFLLLLASVQAFSQKKGKVDPKDLQIDSLTKITVMLTAQLDSVTKSGQSLTMKLDSVSKDRDKYYGVYTSIKEKVIKYSFDPAKTSVLIDSLKTKHDNTFSELTANTTALSDSIKVLNAENAKLQSKIDNMATAEADKEKAINDLRQLKGLLDEKIITQEEYNAKKTKLLEKL
jgi:chromosome segregation ATPase